MLMGSSKDSLLCRSISSLWCRLSAACITSSTWNIPGCLLSVTITIRKSGNLEEPIQGCLDYILRIIHEERVIEYDISAVKPGALDHAQWSGVDLRADLSQHLTEFLRFKLAWADDGFTLDLHMTSQFNWIYILKKQKTVIVIVGIVVMW